MNDNEAPPPVDQQAVQFWSSTTRILMATVLITVALTACGLLNFRRHGVHSLTFMYACTVISGLLWAAKEAASHRLRQARGETATPLFSHPFFAVAAALLAVFGVIAFIAAGVH